MKLKLTLACMGLCETVQYLDIGSPVTFARRWLTIATLWSMTALSIYMTLVRA